MKKFSPNDFKSDKLIIKYRSSKLANTLSKKKPVILFPHLNFFVAQLNNENRILKWTAIQVIGNLSSVDDRGKIDMHIPRLIRFLHQPEMITAANTVKALCVIAQHKPKFKQNIFDEFLKTERNKYYMKGKFSPECRNVVLGQVVNALAVFKHELNNRKDIINFLKRQTKNIRPPVKKRAKRLLKQISL